MTPPLEDHLHRLADDLAAPATREARAAVRRRAGTLRRRRRARTAIGGGVVAVALVAGVAVLQRDDPADVEMGPAGPDAAALPVGEGVPSVRTDATGSTLLLAVIAATVFIALALFQWSRRRRQEGGAP